MCHGNKFSKETKAKLKEVCETFVRTDRDSWDLKKGAAPAQWCEMKLLRPPSMPKPERRPNT